MEKMFCRQCEQTAGGKACTAAGVCGKPAGTARLQDELTDALIAAAGNGERIADGLLLEALFATLTNVNFDDAALEGLIRRVGRRSGGSGGVRGADADESGLKTLLLLGVRGLAAYAYHSLALGRDVGESSAFIHRALAALGEDAPGPDRLLSLALECGKANLDALGLLDRANTETYGDPAPTVVSRAVEPGPFIVVSGHDLRDLDLLLEQSAGQGVNVHTHGEMLPAHAYPGLKRHPHLKGHFGTAWQNQRAEFAGVPAAFLFTTNCLTPPGPDYIDRVFTTAAVGYPGLIHVGGDKDFTPVIRKALSLGGYREARGGGTFTTGFGRAAVLASAGAVVAAVRSGAIRRLFLVGGCDGAKPGRNYFTEFVRLAPADSVILTLGCGKYRFNHLDLGEIGGLPRLLDMGQCNDAYGAVQAALALADSFKCGVNDLPLTIVLSWYEQKAVAVLLSLLHLGVRNIRLGPSLPAFLSANVLKHLAENFGLRPTGDPGADLAEISGR